MSIREDLADVYDGGLRFLDPERYDRAILGVATQAGGLEAVCYDASEILSILMREDGMDFDEAVEFAEFNIYSAYVGPHSPVFLNRYWGARP